MPRLEWPRRRQQMSLASIRASWKRPSMRSFELGVTSSPSHPPIHPFGLFVFIYFSEHRVRGSCSIDDGVAALGGNRGSGTAIRTGVSDRSLSPQEAVSRIARSGSRLHIDVWSCNMSVCLKFRRLLLLFFCLVYFCLCASNQSAE